MANIESASKRVAISKANARTVIIVAISSFIIVFCLVATRSVFNQSSYLSKVITENNKTNNKLKYDLKAYDQLVSSYQKFVNNTTNAIGGSNFGSGQNDGNNGKLILDALPDQYDFPALISSMESIFNTNKLQYSSFTGTDQPSQPSISPSPQPVTMPFTFTLNNANYGSVQIFLLKAQQSIRPIAIDTLAMSGTNSNLVVDITAHTYYQPGEKLSISSKVIK